MRAGGGLARDRREPREIGRTARLELVFAEREGRTRLAHAYAEPPFRVSRCFDDGRGVHLILASSAPGIFPGDRFAQSVRLEPGARVRLTSQSSLQVHPGAGTDAATIESRYEIGDGAALACEWHPTIPFPEARLDQQIAVNVEGEGQLRWSDAAMSGRESRGERWRMACLAHELRVTRRGALQYLERYRLEPGRSRLAARWSAGAANYFGTMLAIGHRHDRAAVDALQQQLRECRGANAAADLLAEDLLLVRLMANAGVPFHAARTRVADLW